ncbi:MAG TPA: LamG-like jellyroll fold domain-containing protein, partial [Chryseosolibacter sp.]
DYHYGYDFAGSPRIKALSVADTLVEYNQSVPVFLATGNVSPVAVYTWHDDTGLAETSQVPAFTWIAPEIAGRNVLLLNIESDGKVVSDSIVFNVVANIPRPPIINALSTDSLWYTTGSHLSVTCDATDDASSFAELTYEWSVSGGTIPSVSASGLTWELPDVEGIFEITCKVTDLDGMSASKKKLVLVKSPASGTTSPWAYYPLDGDVKDYSGNHRDASMVGVDATADARGEQGKAYLFNSGNDIIYLDNSSDLNFQDEISLSFWMKLEGLVEESFILSHGSWEERWKVSVTPDSHLRWTVKTNVGVRDLDSSFPLVWNQYYHFAVVYSGYSMELYAGGVLDTFLAHSGALGTTDKPLTFGRKDGTVTRYSLQGTLDEVRIYDVSLRPVEISTLKTTWNSVVTGAEEEEPGVAIYPNPAHGEFYVNGINMERIRRLSIFETTGRAVDFTMQSSGEQLHIAIQDQSAGLLIVEIETASTVYHEKIFVR